MTSIPDDEPEPEPDTEPEPEPNPYRFDPGSYEDHFKGDR